MSQKIIFETRDGETRKGKLPHAEADHCVVEGACPHCGATPFKAAGVRGSMTKGHDRYTSDAGCVGCKVVTGKLVVVVNTIFGIEEDERVLRGRCRVY
jgi:hypothetical protein